MNNLIEALQILLKYGNPEYPTHCEHDIMIICGIDPQCVSAEDKAKLKDLGFECGSGDWGDEELFYSFKFGSA